jgi:hypothetical protein
MSGHIDRARLNVALASGLTVFLGLWLGHVPGLAVGLAYLGPGMFVFLLLWLGRYPGEEAILRFIRPPRLRRARKSAAPSHRIRVRMPRGGALLAGALAGRAPPLGARSTERPHRLLSGSRRRPGHRARRTRARPPATFSPT